jgi:hypothetical protein
MINPTNDHTIEMHIAELTAFGLTRVDANALMNFTTDAIQAQLAKFDNPEMLAQGRIAQIVGAAKRELELRA